MGREVDAEYFFKPKVVPPPDVNATSVEPPCKPIALQQSQSGADGLPLEGELFTPAALPSYDISLPAPLRKFDIHKVESRRELFQQLNATIPLNEYNLPKYLYRCDLLDPRSLQQAVDSEKHAATSSAQHLQSPTQHLLLGPTPTNGQAEKQLPDSSTAEDVVVIRAQDLLDAAVVPLDYVHGYPTFESGGAIWEQWESESDDAYGAFTAYLELAGVRSLSAIPYAKDACTEFFHLYFWAFRARAFDMFQLAHHERVRVQRIMRTNDTHFLESERIFGKLLKAFNNKSTEDIEGIEPEKLVNMLDKISNMQRKALGISQTTEQPKAPATVEVQMKRIADESGQRTNQDDNADTALLLANPDALATAQELIIKVSGGR